MGSELDAYTEEERQKAIRSILRRQEYYRKHKEERALYYQEHRRERIEYQHRYVSEHREKTKDQCRRYHIAHRDRILEYHRRWNEAHPENRLHYVRKRRALLKGASGNFTAEEFRLLCGVYEGRCAYCKRELPLVPDHAVPLSKGGSNNIENIVPSCAPCNLRKHTMTYEEFVKRLNEKEV